jgi:cell division septation protein DedD
MCAVLRAGLFARTKIRAFGHDRQRGAHSANFVEHDQGEWRTFYKAVEQKDANPELTAPADAKADSTAAAAANSTTTTTAATPTANPNDSTTALPISGYFVQVAAVSKQEDAEALVDALKKKEYPAFVAAQATTDKLFRVQLGPYGEAKEAEAMRTRLIGDGYSPILKK